MLAGDNHIGRTLAVLRSRSFYRLLLPLAMGVRKLESARVRRSETEKQNFMSGIKDKVVGHHGRELRRYSPAARHGEQALQAERAAE